MLNRKTSAKSLVRSVEFSVEMYIPNLFRRSSSRLFLIAREKSNLGILEDIGEHVKVLNHRHYHQTLRALSYM